jgi:hypothetical protein
VYITYINFKVIWISMLCAILSAIHVEMSEPFLNRSKSLAPLVYRLHSHRKIESRSYTTTNTEFQLERCARGLCFALHSAGSNPCILINDAANSGNMMLLYWSASGDSPLAQSAEQYICNQEALGSKPREGITNIKTCLDYRATIIDNLC